MLSTCHVMPIIQVYTPFLLVFIMPITLERIPFDLANRKIFSLVLSRLFIPKLFSSADHNLYAEHAVTHYPLSIIFLRWLYLLSSLSNCRFRRSDLRLVEPQRKTKTTTIKKTARLLVELFIDIYEKEKNLVLIEIQYRLKFVLNPAVLHLLFKHDFSWSHIVSELYLKCRSVYKVVSEWDNKKEFRRVHWERDRLR